MGYDDIPVPFLATAAGSSICLFEKKCTNHHTHRYTNYGQNIKCCKKISKGNKTKRKSVNHLAASFHTRHPNVWDTTPASFSHRAQINLLAYHRGVDIIAIAFFHSPL